MVAISCQIWSLLKRSIKMLKCSMIYLSQQLNFHLNEETLQTTQYCFIRQMQSLCFWHISEVSYRYFGQDLVTYFSLAFIYLIKYICHFQYLWNRTFVFLVCRNARRDATDLNFVHKFNKLVKHWWMCSLDFRKNMNQVQTKYNEWHIYRGSMHLN